MAPSSAPDHVLSDGRVELVEALLDALSDQRLEVDVRGAAPQAECPHLAVIERADSDV